MKISQWSGRKSLAAVMVLGGLLGAGYFALPRSHAIAPVPLSQLGLAPDHSERSAIVAQQMPVFRLVGDAAAKDNTRENVRHWDAMLKVYGSHFPNIAQEIGDCVSWGAANAVNYLQANQIVRGPPGDDEFHPAYPPWIYGASRVWVGAKHGSHFRGDGSVGAYAAEALQTYGCLRADHENVPPYSGNVAKQWGASGPPTWAKDVAKAYLVQTAAPVKTAAEARDAICNGFPVTIASGWWGTADIPVVNGRRVARRTTSWGHQQCLIAYDGSQPGEPLFYCLNSWGPNAHPAPMQGEPPGGYWIRFKDVDHICGEGDSWALSGFDGFPATSINWDDLTRRPITSSAAPNNGGYGGGTMFIPMEVIGLVACLLMAAVGVWLFSRARKSARLGGALGAALALSLMAGVTQAQDFGSAAKRETCISTAYQQTSDVWGQAATRQTIEAPAVMEWGPAEKRQSANVVESKGAKEPQALVFLRAVGCSDCIKEKNHLLKNVAPNGWTVGEDPQADFRLIDVQKEPTLAQRFAVAVVPTTVYLDKSGKVIERREGFSTDRNWTSALQKLRVN